MKNKIYGAVISFFIGSFFAHQVYAFSFELFFSKDIVKSEEEIIEEIQRYCQDIAAESEYARRLPILGVHETQGRSKSFQSPTEKYLKLIEANIYKYTLKGKSGRFADQEASLIKVVEKLEDANDYITEISIYERDTDTSIREKKIRGEQVSEAFGLLVISLGKNLDDLRALANTIEKSQKNTLINFSDSSALLVKNKQKMKAVLKESDYLQASIRILEAIRENVENVLMSIRKKDGFVRLAISNS